MSTALPERVRVEGPLAPFAAGFGCYLARRGYPPCSVVVRMLLMAHLSRWLDQEELGPDDLRVDVVERFTSARRAEGRTWLSSPRALEPLLGFLAEENALAASEPPLASTPVEEVLEHYTRFLVGERGLAACTIDDRRSVAFSFLSSQTGPGGLDLAHLSAGDVSRFVLECCRRHLEAPARSAANPATLCSGLRCLLRFLFLQGRTQTDLSLAVPSAKRWRLAGLPKVLEPDQVARLLESCDRSTPLGSRDFAILTMLSRLGLRSAEVAGLSFGDIDWRAGEIEVAGKGARVDRLPLPDDVGRAVVAYLREGRPRCKCPKVFLRAVAPREGLTPGAIGMIVRVACDRAGIPRVGAHALRHFVATTMLARGASLAEIGQVLRHKRLATTVIY